MRNSPNPVRGAGLTHGDLQSIPWPVSDAAAVLALLARCPKAAETPLLDAPGLAGAAGVARVHVKDERERMGLGSFKALGAAHVIAREAEAGLARGRVYACASAGNHGLSVAAAAAVFGAKARIYLSEAVPRSFADRLLAEGAQVVRAGATYEESVAESLAAAESEGLELLSDTSWAGYVERPRAVMEGYLALMAEAAARMPRAPSHIFLQAGVGGLAAAAAAHARSVWGNDPVIVVVEPEAAPALAASVAARRPVTSQGPRSIMGRLDCKDPSLIALKGLARDADHFSTITDDEARAGSATAAALGLESTPSGAAGIAALLSAGPLRAELGLDAASRVLTILSERAE